MSKNNQALVENPDYKMDLWDGFLSLIKKMVTSGELRHHFLPVTAVFGDLMPGKRPKNTAALNCVLTFPDQSQSLKMASPVVLAAGSVKYAEVIPHFAKLGFGALSVGTTTRFERTGNPQRPRVALIEADRMMHNSMGLNNPGVDKIAQKVKASLDKAHARNLCVGISVSETPGLQTTEERLEDLKYTFTESYKAADYIEVNLSCPNTGHDRLDAQWDFLTQVIEQIARVRESLIGTFGKKAILAKLSPDLSEEILVQTLDLLKINGWSGVVLFNTWPGTKRSALPLTRQELPAMRADGDVGGLSGRLMYPHMKNSVEKYSKIYPELVFWGSGGVDCGQKVSQILERGASAAQIYSVLGFRWNPVWKILAEYEECRSNS